jgi:hypothetical protein
VRSVNHYQAAEAGLRKQNIFGRQVRGQTLWLISNSVSLFKLGHYLNVYLLIFVRAAAVILLI